MLEKMFDRHPIFTTFALLSALAIVCGTMAAIAGAALGVPNLMTGGFIVALVPIVLFMFGFAMANV